ncbi:MAG TPA: hypothetical protein VN809_13815 [Telmatospirillum sp.]|nr:hypothetical protein [Telmatospirillum sp.]
MPATTDGLDVVSFFAGGFRFAVESRHVHGMLADRDADTVTVEDLIGLPLERDSTKSHPALRHPVSRKCLLIGGARDCVEVGGPVELETLPADSLYPLPPPVKARMSLGGIKGLAMTSAGILLIVDLAAVSASARTSIDDLVPPRSSL